MWHSQIFLRSYENLLKGMPHENRKKKPEETISHLYQSHKCYVTFFHGSTRHVGQGTQTVEALRC